MSEPSSRIPLVGGRDFNDRHLFVSDWTGTPYQVPRVQVYQCSELRCGDHCLLDRVLYTHHFIICDVCTDDNYFEVIHFQPTGSYKGKVVKEKYIFEDGQVWPEDKPQKKTKLYLLLHRDEHCHRPEMVISIAENVLGNPNFNVDKNNCENLSMACKRKSSPIKAWKIANFNRGTHGYLDRCVRKNIHFIVENVNTEESKVDIIRFDKVKSKIIGKRDSLVFDNGYLHSVTNKNKWQVYVVMHDPEDCYSIDDTLDIASHLMNEDVDARKFSSETLVLISKFAAQGIQCQDENSDKTIIYSFVESEYSTRHEDESTIKIHSDQCSRLQKRVGRISTQGVLRVGGEGLAAILARAVAKGAIQMSGKGLRVVGGVAGGIPVLVIDLGFMSYDIHRTRMMYKHGDIRGREMGFAIGKRVTHTVALSAGAVAGGTLGQILIPVPVVGAMVGTLIGMSAGVTISALANNGIEHLAETTGDKRKQ